MRRTEILALAAGTALRVVVESTVRATSELGLGALVASTPRIRVVLSLRTATGLTVRSLIKIGSSGHLPLLGLAVVARLTGAGAHLRARTAELAVGG